MRRKFVASALTRGEARKGLNAGPGSPLHMHKAPTDPGGTPAANRTPTDSEVV